MWFFGAMTTSRTKKKNYEILMEKVKLRELMNKKREQKKSKEMKFDKIKERKEKCKTHDTNDVEVESTSCRNKFITVI